MNALKRLPLARLLAVAICATLTTASLRPLHADNYPSAIYVMRVDGSQLRKLAEVPDHHDHGSPRWSHDGKQVAFDAASGPNGEREFYVVQFDGSGLRRLGAYARPDWSADDKQLAYDVYGPNGAEIKVKNLDGQGESVVAHGVSGRWSPDGSQLAVTDHKMLRVVDLVSSEERALFEVPFVDLFGGYNWSPDGQQLALSARPAPGKRRQLILVDARGAAHGMRVRLEGEQGGSISFSPDGKQLVFADGYVILIVDVAGKGPPRPVPGQVGKNREPHWSPDGQWIVFSSDRDRR